MTGIRRACVEFVSDRFQVRRSFVEAAWDIIEKGVQIPEGLEQRGHVLGIAGPENAGAVRAVIIFVEVDKALRDGSVADDTGMLVHEIGARRQADASLIEAVTSAIQKVMAERASQVVYTSSTAPEVAELAYARVWSNDPDIGQEEPISRERFKSLLEDRARFEIFIVDRGQYSSPHGVGTVYLGGIDVSRHRRRRRQRAAEKQENKNRKKRPSARLLSPLGYRLLFYLLTHYERAGTRDVVLLAEHCWRRRRTTATLKAMQAAIRALEDGGRLDELKGKKSEFHEETSKHRTAVAKLSDVIERFTKARFQTEGEEDYSLTSDVDYCVIRVHAATAGSARESGANGTKTVPV